MNQTLVSLMLKFRNLAPNVSWTLGNAAARQTFDTFSSTVFQRCVRYVVARFISKLGPAVLNPNTYNCTFKTALTTSHWFTLAFCLGAAGANTAWIPVVLNSLSLSLSLYVYIYIERERDYMYILTYTYIYTCICICVHM